MELFRKKQDSLKWLLFVSHRTRPGGAGRPPHQQAPPGWPAQWVRVSFGGNMLLCSLIITSFASVAPAPGAALDLSPVFPRTSEVPWAPWCRGMSVWRWGHLGGGCWQPSARDPSAQRWDTIQLCPCTQVTAAAEAVSLPKLSTLSPLGFCFLPALQESCT